MALLRNPRLALLNQENAQQPKRLGTKTAATTFSKVPRVALNDIRNRQTTSDASKAADGPIKPKAGVRKPQLSKPANIKKPGAGHLSKRPVLKRQVTTKVPAKKIDDETEKKYIAPVLRSRKSTNVLAEKPSHLSENINEEVVEKRNTRSSAANYDLDSNLISALTSCTASSSGLGDAEQLHDASGAGAFSSAANSVLPEGVFDIDEEDADNPLMVTDYVQDIYLYLRRLEEHQSIRENFLVNSGVSGKMRAILVDWMVDVQIRFKLLPETLYMAVGLLDRFLQKVMVSKASLQLVASSALFIASKYEEIYAPEIADFEYISDSSCDVNAIRQMELRILKTLDFKVGRPLAIHFLRRYSKAAEADATRHTIGKFVCEAALIEYSLAHVPPSLVAAVACFMAGRLLEVEEEWGPEMVYYSGYELDQLKPVMKSIAELLLKLMYQKSFAQKAVLLKYNSKKLLSIAKEPCFEEANLRTLFL